MITVQHFLDIYILQQAQGHVTLAVADKSTARQAGRQAGEGCSAHPFYSQFVEGLLQYFIVRHTLLVRVTEEVNLQAVGSEVQVTPLLIPL